MIYKQQDPKVELQHIIKSFWLIDSESDATIKKEKIIPDGYPELIFHYKSPYKANIFGEWHTQSNNLVAGQIRNHFYLENTGLIGIFGIKLQPWALKLLCDFDMSKITDSVVSLKDAKFVMFNSLSKIVNSDINFEKKVSAIEEWFVATFNVARDIEISKGHEAAQLIIEKKGAVSIQEVLDTIKISERSLERYFKIHIGLSPKFYSRVIRFSNIFNHIESESFDWSDITYLSGFYDQSHFIKNFKEFTGEEPSKYGFNEKSMANFFLKK